MRTEMINFKCRNCGGEMSVSVSGDLSCSYCGSKAVFTDKDLRDYKDFRYRLLAYLSAISDSPDTEQTDRIWRYSATEEYSLSDGRPLRINYLFKGMQNGVTVYTARRNVIFLFPEDDGRACEHFADTTGRLEFPPADIKGLANYFPVIAGSFRLKNGGMALSVIKDEELYPLSAFGSLPAEHAAWIVSRLENLCCVLAYSEIAHNGIDPESVFINARTHEAFLLGGWWNSAVSTGGSVQDLLDLRKTAKRITGTGYDSSPEEFRKFITSPPAGNAFDDFTQWDRVIETGFHGRKFKKLDLSNLQI